MTEEFEQLYRTIFSLSICTPSPLPETRTWRKKLPQETFFRAMEHIDRFEGRSRATTWLCQIAKKPLPLPLPGLQAVHC